MNVLPILALHAASSLHACAVCFGKGAAPGFIRGLILSGGVLLGATFLMIGGIVYAVCQVEKRRAEAEKAAHP